MALVAGWPGAATAQAGGHFDVDDAGTLDPGQCQYEVWGGHGHRSRDPRLWHLGPACRVGPVELGLNLDRISVAGDRLHALGPQLKWTFFGQAPDARWRAAVSMGAIYDCRATAAARAGSSSLPVTWRATDSLQVNANLGADWAAGDRRAQRPRRAGRRMGAERHGVADRRAQPRLRALDLARRRALQPDAADQHRCQRGAHRTARACAASRSG